MKVIYGFFILTCFLAMYQGKLSLRTNRDTGFLKKADVSFNLKFKGLNGIENLH